MLLIFIPILAFLPAIFWILIFLREEKYDPISKKLIIKMFILGAAGGILAVILELSAISPLPKTIATVFLEPGKIKTLDFNLAIAVVALTIILAAIEEIVKLAILRWNAFDSLQFNQVVDGAVLGISVALGFATFENLGYFFQAFVVGGASTLVMVFLARFLATTLLHALATGIAGYFLGKEKFSGNKAFLWYGLVVAILIHSIFNIFLLTLTVLGLLLVIGFLIGVFIFLIRRMGSVEAQTIWRLVPFRKIYSSSSLTGSSRRL